MICVYPYFWKHPYIYTQKYMTHVFLDSSHHTKNTPEAWTTCLPFPRMLNAFVAFRFKSRPIKKERTAAVPRSTIHDIIHKPLQLLKIKSFKFLVGWTTKMFTKHMRKSNWNMKPFKFRGEKNTKQKMLLQPPPPIALISRLQKLSRQETPNSV